MLNIIIKEIKELCADKKIWIGILTVLIIIIIGTSYNTKNKAESPSKPLKLGVINHDNSTYSQLLVNNFIASKTFSSLVTVMEGDEKKVKGAFRQGKVDIYLEVPKDFAANMMQLKHTPVNVTMNVSDTTKAILFQNVLKSYEKYITAVEINAVGLYDIMEQDGVDQEQIDKSNHTMSINLIMTALGREEFFDFRPVEQFPSTPLFIYYLCSILVTALLYSGLYVGFQICKELEQGTFTRLRTTMTHVSHFIAAKMVLLTGVLTIVASVSMSVIAGKPVAKEGILLCLSMAMLCVTQAVLLSAVFIGSQRFLLVGNLMAFFFTILGGGIIPIQYLPQNMVQISKFTTDYYMLKGILLILSGQSSDASFLIFAFFILSLVMAGVAVILLERRRVKYCEV